jgi:energy-converting hydrogenase Eha subunit A
MSIRKCALILAVACASVLVVPVAASAQSAPTSESVASFTSVPVHGKTASGKMFNGHFTVNRFITENGKSMAVGHLTGFVGHRGVNKTGVAIPIAVQQPSTTSATTAALAACPILHLVLGPLNLNLLGLHITLNQVVLNITAIPGAGNLLGNLLCDVANLLNGTGGTTALTPAQVTGLLGVLQQTLAVPSLLTL